MVTELAQSGFVDAVPLIALVALLVTAYLHPRQRTEALVAVLAGAAVLATGRLGPADLATERRHLLPVVLFLMAILVVAECCRAAGLFTAIGSRLAGAGRTGRTFTLTFLVATVTTVALSLDATVVLVTPVVLAAALGLGADGRPFQLVCVRLANTASLLLPVSNLTNLLAVPALGLTFGRFALLMAPVWLFALLVEYVVHRLWFRTALAAPRSGPTSGPTSGPILGPRPLPTTVLVVVGLMLVGFALGSLRGIDPAWVAGAAALVLTVRGRASGELRADDALHSTHAPFALFVLSLGLVVAALGDGPFGSALADLVPATAGLAGLLTIAVLGAGLANLVNNLPATLLLVPLTSPLGSTAVLAGLVGINLGSSLTWSGSLANLLWRRSVVRSGGEVSSRDFHAVALLATPVSVLGGVLILHAWSGVG